MICEHCGEPFTSSYDPYATTTEVSKRPRSFREDLEEKIAMVNRPAPAQGVAIYIVDRPDPIEIRLENEFIIGRMVEPTEEKIVDLTAYDSFALGVSRRHLMVRRIENGYEVMDLNSRNGTWVDERSLAPQTPLAIKSGSQIRLGNLRIVLSFRQPGIGSPKE